MDKQRDITNFLLFLFYSNVSRNQLRKRGTSLHRYYKIIMVPTVIIITAVLCSGMISFGEQSYEAATKVLLKERTDILQNYFYGKLDRQQAEQKLKEIETYPLLKKDLAALNVEDGCRADAVKSMNIKKISESSKLYHMISFETEIEWSMSSVYGDYETSGEYFVVLNSENNNYKLSEFNIK